VEKGKKEIIFLFFLFLFFIRFEPSIDSAFIPEIAAKLRRFQLFESFQLALNLSPLLATYQFVFSVVESYPVVWLAEFLTGLPGREFIFTVFAFHRPTLFGE